MLLRCLSSFLSESYIKSIQGLLNEWMNACLNEWMNEWQMSLFFPFSIKCQVKLSPWLSHHLLLESLIKIKSYHGWYVCQDQIRNSSVETLSFNHRRWYHWAVPAHYIMLWNPVMTVALMSSHLIGRAELTALSPASCTWDGSVSQQPVW